MGTGNSAVHRVAFIDNHPQSPHLHTMYHYLDSSKKPQGPFSIDQLRDLEAKGLITSETLVASAGDSKWRPWREISGRPFSMSSVGNAPEETVADRSSYASLVESLNQKLESTVIRVYEKWPGPGVSVRAEFDRLLAFWNFVLQLGVLVAGALAAILFVIAAIRLDNTYLVLVGLAAVPAFFVLQYVVSLFAAANIRLLNGPTIMLFSMVLPKAFLIVGSVVSMLWGLVGGVLTVTAFSNSLSGGISMLGTWLATLFVAIFACWLAARSCDALNVRSVPASEQNAADYFANLIRLLGRFLLALTPLIGALATISLIVLLLGIGGQLLSDDQQSIVFQFMSGAILATASFTLGLVFLLPLIAHFTYISIVTLSEMVTAFFRLVHDNSRMVADLPASKPGSRE